VKLSCGSVRVDYVLAHHVFIWIFRDGVVWDTMVVNVHLDIVSHVGEVVDQVKRFVCVFPRPRGISKHILEVKAGLAPMHLVFMASYKWCRPTISRGMLSFERDCSIVIFIIDECLFFSFISKHFIVIPE